MSSTTSSKSKGPSAKKRKRRTSPEEQLEEERLERYNKLVHMATKALHKEAKTVKSFECQKIVRRLKQSHSTQDEEKLAHVKAFPLERVEQVCLQRLGIFNLNPKPPQEEEQSEIVEPSQDDEKLVERMLRHKRMISAMDTWNDKVTEFRRWHLKRQERISNVPDFSTDKKNMPKKKQKKDDTASDMFVCLGGASMDEEAMAHYGPAGQEDEYAAIVKTKNRPGQRARKAKAMAIQAKKEGRDYVSVNWREKKPRPKDDGDKFQNKKTGGSKPQPAQAAEIAAMGKSWKEEGKEHPSWAASQSQKAGIVAFQGKKITFD